MNTPNARKLITVSQFEYLQELAQKDVNSICVIFAFYESRTWMPNLSDDITYWSDSDKYAINTQDYYHYFGYDVVLPKYIKAPYNPWLEGLGLNFWMAYDNDTWSVRCFMSAGNGKDKPYDVFIGTEAECREKVIEMTNALLLPTCIRFKFDFKFNFKFQHEPIDATQT